MRPYAEELAYRGLLMQPKLGRLRRGNKGQRPLAQERLGEFEKARVTLARLRKLMRDQKWEGNSEARAFGHEAEAIELERLPVRAVRTLIDTEALSSNDNSRTRSTSTQPMAGSHEERIPLARCRRSMEATTTSCPGSCKKDTVEFLHATLHANLEICVILAILEKRKSLFSWIFGFPDHPHTVEVTGSNPVPPISIRLWHSKPARCFECQLALFTVDDDRQTVAD